jgi:hypothetical protein
VGLLLTIMSREAFLARLDGHGIVRDHAGLEPSRAEAYTVFAQRDDATIETATWQRHAAQFFESRLGLTANKVYTGDAGSVCRPDRDAAQVMLAFGNREAETRLCYGRPRTDDDLFAAEAADRRAGLTGLGDLARRCRMVWLFAVHGDEDLVALRLSAIVASVVLGPILSPDQSALFGVRTARLKLESPRPRSGS